MMHRFDHANTQRVNNQWLSNNDSKFISTMNKMWPTQVDYYKDAQTMIIKVLNLPYIHFGYHR